MALNIIHTENAPAAVGPYSQAVVINGRVYESLALYTEVALIYLFFCSLLTLLQRWGEKKLNAYGGVR